MNKNKFIERLKLPPFWEITVLALILIGVNFLFFPDDPGYHNISLNPFLFLLLLTVVRYGTVWGYYAAGISVFYYMLTPPYSLDALLSRFLEVVLFLVVLLVFGAIQGGYAVKIKTLEEKVKEEEDKYRELNERYGVISFLKENYEKKILTQTTTMADLYGDARNMQVLDMEELYREIHVIIQKYVEAEKSSLYILEGNMLKLKSFRGYEDETKPEEEISLSQNPYKMVFEREDLVGINESQFKETIISDLPVYCGPLKNSGGDIFGVLNVNNIRLLNFNRINKKLFSLICEWSSKAIENARSYKIAEGRRIITTDTQIFKYEYFLMRLEDAYMASKETDTVVVFLLIEIMNWENVLSENKKSVLKFVARTIQQNMRDFDVLAHFEKEYEFALLMTQADDKEVKFFINNLMEKIELFSLKPFGDNSTLKLRINSTENLKNYKSIDDIIAGVRK